MMEQNKILKEGLRPLPPDKRDYKPEKLGGIFKYADMPKKSFRISEPLKIRDQGSDDTCSARMAAALLEDTEKTEIAEEWQFAQTKFLEGSIKGWGADLRTAFQIPRKFGALERKDCPFTFEEKGRDFCADWNNYDAIPLLKTNALIHKQKTFFRADQRKRKDYFDSLALSLFQNQKSLGFGILWSPQWLYVKGGIIEKDNDREKIGHALKCFGYEKTISNEYLVVQNSAGEDVGDKGIFYLCREVVNSGQIFGALMFVDLTDEEVERIKNPSLIEKIKGFFMC